MEVVDSIVDGGVPTLRLAVSLVSVAPNKTEFGNANTFFFFLPFRLRRLFGDRMDYYVLLLL